MGDRVVFEQAKGNHQLEPEINVARCKVSIVFVEGSVSRNKPSSSCFVSCPTRKNGLLEEVTFRLNLEYKV